MDNRSEVGKGEILQNLPIMLREQAELESRLSSATLRYRDLVATNEPRIRELSQQADALAIEFRRLYREASDAFAEDEKELAKQLSIEGREVQSRCEALNHEANEMRTDLRSLRDLIATTRQRSKEIRSQIVTLGNRLTTLRTTTVRGFEQSGLLDNIALERTLDLLPQSVLGVVDTIEYQKEIWEIMSSGRKFPARGRTTWNAIDHATIQIARQPASTAEEARNQYAYVLAHEVGHVAYEKFASDEEKANWFAVSEEASTPLSSYSVASDVEDFAEAFAFFVLYAAYLEQRDPKRYSYMRTMITRMRARK